MSNQNYNTPSAIGDLFHPRVIYLMPLYQRQYCWRHKELDLYKKDLLQIFKIGTSVKKESVFLGAVVLQTNAHNVRESNVVTVIDGQQRITTLYLTIAAMSKYAFENNWNDVATQLIERHLRSDGLSTVDQSTLVPTANDTQQFQDIMKSLKGGAINFTNLPQGEKKGALTQAFDFIFEKIIKESMYEIDQNSPQLVTFNAFVDVFFENFVISDINLSSEHNPNEVFDRLNTRGQKLGIIDLIRNDCLRPLTPQQAEVFYKNEWVPFENSLGFKFQDKKITIEQQVDNFFYPYAKCKSSSIRKNQLLRDLEDSWGSITPSQKINDMTSYIDPYFTWIEGKDIEARIDSSYSQTLKDSIISLKQYNPPVSVLPFLMQCLFHINNGLSETDAAHTFNIMESFFVRRALSFQDEGTGYEKVFKNLWDSTQGEPNKVRKLMPMKTKSFPTDAEFEDGIKKTDIYGKRIQYFLIYEYEKSLKKQAKEFYPKQFIETIDHINPQNIKGLSLADGLEHERTVHLWGNLLPMSKILNSSKSNRMINPAFINELNINSSFETTKEFLKIAKKNGNKWSFNLIDTRTSNIAKWAITRWKIY